MLGISISPSFFNTEFMSVDTSLIKYVVIYWSIYSIYIMYSFIICVYNI